MNLYDPVDLECIIACETAVSDSMKAHDKFVISVMENAKDPDFQVLYEMDMESVREAFITAIQNILDALAEFTRKVIVAMSSAIQSKKLDDKLAEVKEIMAKNRAKFLDKKITIIDMAKYNKYYSDYIKKYTKQVKDMTSRKFDSIEEYEDWRDKMQQELSEFNFKLTDEEQWKLTVSINKAIELSEDEAKNYKQNIELAHQYGEKTITDLKGSFKKEEKMSDSEVNQETKAASLLRMSNNLVITCCNQIASIIRSVIRMIQKHPFATLALVIVAIAM